MSSRPMVGAARSASPGARRRPARGADAVVVLGSLLLAALIAGHWLVPDVLGIGLLLDSVAPWLGLGIVLLLPAAAAASRWRVRAVVLAPVLVWMLVFVPLIVPLSWTAPPTREPTLTVASQNVEEGSGGGVQSAGTLAERGADVIALQEMDSATIREVGEALGADYPHSFAIGTVGLWSRYPVVNAQALPLGLGWNRALAADLETPDGLVSIYVVHAASARPDDLADRDRMLAELADTLPKDENARAVVVGDFNAATTDRAFVPLMEELGEPRQSSGGFGFSWPSAFPVTRLDHVLVKGMDVVENETISAGQSDHLALVTTMNLSHGASG